MTRKGAWRVRKIVGALASVTLLVSALAIGTAPSASAAASVASTLTMTDFQMQAGGNVPLPGLNEFDRTNATMQVVDASNSELRVSATAPKDPETFLWLWIEPAPGQAHFTTGYVQTDVQPLTPGYAWLSVDKDGSGCTGAGSIDVRDVAYKGDTIVRLDLLWTSYCGSLPGEVGIWGDFGEITLGEPSPSPAVLASRNVVWSPVSVGAQSMSQPIVISNHGPGKQSIGAASISGSNAGEFLITANKCSGHSLSVGKQCSIWVQYAPKVAGPRSATFTVTVSGKKRTVPLDGTTFVGTSMFTAITTGGDIPGIGGTYTYTDADPNALFEAGRGGNALVGAVMTPPPVSGLMYNLRFAGPGYSQPQVGSYNVPDDFGYASGVIDVTSAGIGCSDTGGSFTINQAVYAADGTPLHIDLVYSEHCIGSTNTLSGEWAYHATPVFTPPPQVTALGTAETAGVVTVHWTNPTSGWAYTVVRVQPTDDNDANAQPVSGTAVYTGVGTTSAIHGLTAGTHYTVSAFTVDSYGNVSAPVEAPANP
jgi:hypothetical protein